MPGHSLSSSEEDSCEEEFETPNRSPQSSIDNEDSGDSGSFLITSKVECPSDLRAIQVDSALITAEELESGDNELWFVTVPSNTNVKKLHHKQFPFKGKSKVAIGETNYEAKVYKNMQSVNIIVPDKKGNLKLKMKKCMGSLIFTEDVFIPEDRIPIATRDEVVVPTDLKERHPIFGRDFAEVIACAKRTLDPAELSTSKIKSGKSPKKRRKMK